MGCSPFRRLTKKSRLASVESKLDEKKAMLKDPVATSSSSVTLQTPHAEYDIVQKGHLNLPPQQAQLQLHAPKQAFELTQEAPIPAPKGKREALIKIQTISLNPVDWKGPAFNFGLPSLPCVLGRDLAGVIVKPPENSSRLKIGDSVCAVSTDYRDYRKAAFQQYAVASDFNIFRIPPGITRERASATGVAFITAALTLGVCLGLDFSAPSNHAAGPDLQTITRSLGKLSVPEDIRDECFEGIRANERLKTGDWLAIWGASSTVGFLTLQLAKLFGIKVICIADAIKHGQLLVSAGANLLVHRERPEEAVSIVKSVTDGNLRFAVDTVGKTTASLLQDTLLPGERKEAEAKHRARGHLVGLTGGPSDLSPAVQQHKVPIKLFHESPVVGEALVTWMEALLASGGLQLPKVDISDLSGLDAVNPALDRLKEGSLSGQRIVVNI